MEIITLFNFRSSISAAKVCDEHKVEIFFFYSSYHQHLLDVLQYTVYQSCYAKSLRDHSYAL